VKTSLRILPRRPQLKQVENRLYVGIKAVVSLACKSDITPSKVGDGLAGVMIQFPLSSDPVTGWILAVISLIIEWGGIALIVRRNNSASKLGPVVVLLLPMIHFGNGVGLSQILRRIADILHNPDVGLQDGVFAFEPRLELELITNG